MRVSVSRKIFRGVNTLVMVALCLICFLPFLHMVFASVSDPFAIRQHIGLLLRPIGFNIQGYLLVLRKPIISAGFKNTVFITLIGTALSILLSSMGAYALGKRNAFWTKYIMKMITVTMFISGGLIPFYLVVQGVGLTDTVFAMILPYCVNTWNMLVMRSSFRGIPESLEESTRIDGANDFTILFRIVIPLSLPVMAVMVLFYMLQYWNTWFPAVLFIRKRALYPLQLVMRDILIKNDTSSMGTISELAELNEEYYVELVKYTTIVIATLPIIFVYPFLQKYFVTGILVGSLKE